MVGVAHCCVIVSETVKSALPSLVVDFVDGQDLWLSPRGVKTSPLVSLLATSTSGNSRAQAASVGPARRSRYRFGIASRRPATLPSSVAVLVRILCSLYCKAFEPKFLTSLARVFLPSSIPRRARLERACSSGQDATCRDTSETRAGVTRKAKPLPFFGIMDAEHG